MPERKNIKPELVVSVVSGLARQNDNNNNSAPDVMPEDSVTLPLQSTYSLSLQPLIHHALSFLPFCLFTLYRVIVIL